mmetsp:Transcript_22647/g.47505  ORF Transcript_22647/g.47505 Transcript_22647/m.47505 type:complete len:107 (-) Transcript_22647:257-577(-)
MTGRSSYGSRRERGAANVMPCHRCKKQLMIHATITNKLSPEGRRDGRKNAPRLLFFSLYVLESFDCIQEPSKGRPLNERMNQLLLSPRSGIQLHIDLRIDGMPIIH